MIWFLLPALAAEEPVVGDTDLAALKTTLSAELEANQDLQLGDAPPIYHLRYHLLQLDHVSAEASFGSLVNYDVAPFDQLGVEVRVGSPELDNTGFGGWQNGFSRAGLPSVITDYALRLTAWRITDQAYKQAIEQWARKDAQFTPPEDYPGNYTLTGPTTATQDIPAVGGADPIFDLSRQLSAAFIGPVPLLRGEVRVGHEVGSHLILDSEGTDVLRPYEETSIRAYAHLRADDGMLLTDHRLWTVRAPGDLPPTDALLAEVTALRDGLAEISETSPLSEEYVGPVILEDDAATDLFRYLLAPQLEGTPAEVPFDSWFGDLGDSNDPVRLGRRVLPVGWTVADDPNGQPDHPSAYEYDFEGTPAEAVDLVDSGIVRRVLMSRVPRKGASDTNGHARGYPGTRAKARVTQLTVTAPKQQKPARLRKKAAKIAQSYGRDWFLVIKRLQEPSVRGVGQGFMLFGSDEGAALPPPVAVVKVYTDGREEVLRGAQFASVERFVLRDILAAGPTHTSSYMAPLLGNDYGGMGPTEGLPTWISAPEVLIGEVEIVPAPGDPMDVPLLTPPTQ